MAEKMSCVSVASSPFLRKRAFSPISLRTFTFLTILLVGFLTGWPERPASAATLPSGFTETLVAGGMSSPTAMAIAPDGRIFVCQQGGQLRVVKNGALLASPFLTVTVSSTGERGLLGVAFDPNFTANQFIYIYYTATTPSVHNRISRFTANGDVVVPGSEQILLDLNNLSATNHNGGAMHFGPDGKLYVAVGENAVSSNSQTLNNLLGKMLRINSDGSIPADNPFFNQATGNNRAIWTLGLRNPFTFNFQPGTGRMFINDVGQVTWEEVNDGIAGSNYGWPSCESPCSPPNVNFRDPIYYYSNDANTCAITGGTFYNPASATFPAQYAGKYFLADFCGGWIKYIDPASPPGVGGATNFASGLSSPVDLQVGSDGSLYYLQRGGGGQLWRIQYTANQAPMISQHPVNQTVNAGQTATFNVTASGTAPLTYVWRRNNMDIPNTNSASYTTPPTVAGDNGAQYTVFVSNSAGDATSNPATLTVITNQPPTATITQPTAGTLYSGGETINFAGTGTDPENGTLPASAFTWRVDFHHDTHEHPFMQPTSGITSGSFVIPTTGETAANVWYRIHLTVTDAGGAQHSVFRDVLPRTVTLTVAANPVGARITLDGQPMTTPVSVLSVVGIERELGVVSPQNVNGQIYQFASWSDAGAATHTISTPATDTTYTASFTQVPGLMFYPLPKPIRLLETRAGFTGCDAPGAPIPGGTSRTQLARRTCDGVTIPADALAITGNVTTVQSGGGFLTLYPSDVAQPTVANSNYAPNEVLNNVFTVGLGSDGAFKIFVTSDTHAVVDVTGYYAPPGVGGLYFHPLPNPVRLLDTRPGAQACYQPGAPLIGDVERIQTGVVLCGASIPLSARAIVGNATVVNSNGGFLTLFPADVLRPVVSNSNFSTGQVMNAPFTVGLSANGDFKIYPQFTTDLVIDVSGYYSPDASDINGPGLLFTPLAMPVRLLETRAGFSGCSAPGSPINGNTELTQPAQGTCAGVNIPNTAKAVVGNATVVNSNGGFLTFWPSNAARPLAANSNFVTGQVHNRHFTVGLGPDGAFKIYSQFTTDLVIDLSGYFAP
jgi:glucose/arabinose dehydrogenase